MPGQTLLSDERRGSPARRHRLGILLANGCIDEHQHIAALKYAGAHAFVFGKLWNIKIPIARELGWHGSEPAELTVVEPAELTVVEARESARQVERPARSDQRLQVANLAVFGFIPQRFVARQAEAGPLPTDEAEREALLPGLDALAQIERGRERGSSRCGWRDHRAI